MPAKKKPVKKATKAKKIVSKLKSQSEKKKAPKLVAKKAEKKKGIAAPHPKASGGNIFWKVLEMRRQEREARLRAEQGHHDSKDPKHVYNDKHSRFARFAGPRRRAA